MVHNILRAHLAGNSGIAFFRSDSQSSALHLQHRFNAWCDKHARPISFIPDYRGILLQRNRICISNFYRAMLCIAAIAIAH